MNAHVEDICKKMSRKKHALARITPTMTVLKGHIPMNAFFREQFSYCPLVWICHGRAFGKTINRPHKRCLRVVYNDKRSSFQNLLYQDRSVSVHTYNLRTLAIEMYKILDMHRRHCRHCNARANYHIRYQSELSRPFVKSMFNVAETI